MTTAELATALPEIVTEQVPGPKAKELLAYLQLELKKDPNPGNVIGMTKLQLVEITRKKIRKTLEESLHG